jgi:uncharacterized membrane protein YjjP (DUF1212 family)
VQPFTFSRFLVLAAFALSAIASALLFFGTDTLSLIKAFAWLFLVFAVYLASLLVP